MMRRPAMSEMPDAKRSRAHGLLHGFGLRRLVYSLRTEGTGTAQETAAIAVGVFIGCLPFFGFHLLLCVLVGWLFRLNRLKVYLAANISNPLVAPWLLFAELQTGSWLRRGTFHSVTLETLRSTGVTVLGADLLLGSVAVGATLAGLAAWGTYYTLRGSADDRHFIDLVRRASDRYLSMSITAWEFARGKLRNDPVYRSAVYGDVLGASGSIGGGASVRSVGRTVVDVGCGQGLMLAMLAEVRRASEAGTWPPGSHPPLFERLVGVEMRPRVAAIARTALGNEAEIVTGDARNAAVPNAHAVLLFDVLHLMPAPDQESLLASLAASLQADGIIVVREGDASAGWRFAAVRVGNRLKALAIGRWRQQFHFRSTSEWLRCFERLGFDAEVRPMGAGTPFGNVLFRVTASTVSRAQAPGDSAPTSPLAPAV